MNTYRTTLLELETVVEDAIGSLRQAAEDLSQAIHATERAMCGTPVAHLREAAKKIQHLPLDQDVKEIALTMIDLTNAYSDLASIRTQLRASRENIENLFN